MEINQTQLCFHFSTENDGGGIIKRNRRHCENWTQEVVKSNYFCFLQGLLDQEKVQR
jgi:hypothetical protein